LCGLRFLYLMLKKQKGKEELLKLYFGLRNPSSPFIIAVLKI